MYCMYLYGCETWSLTLRVFENRVLRRISGSRRDKVTGEWTAVMNLIKVQFSKKKNVFEREICVSIFSIILSETFLILGRMERDTIKNTFRFS